MLSTSEYLDWLIRQFCLSPNLLTYDPYDIWKTRCGFRVKHFYNCHRFAGLFPAGVFACFDLMNNRRRLFYTPSEFAIVRAQAALCLLNVYQKSAERCLLEAARRHLDWLLAHSCTGYCGPCWGLGFWHAVSNSLVYDPNTPLAVMTPYALEAFLQFARVSGENRDQVAISGMFRFFEQDIQVMHEDAERLATSYGPFKDRIVINAISYSMYARALSLPYLEPQQRRQTERSVRKLYAYIRSAQQDSGAWWYAPQPGSFIDCFHSCIVLKNIFKTNQLLPLDASDELLKAGYAYVIREFLDESRFLFRRFSVANKPGLIRFDLYDSAEALQVAILLGDRSLAERLLGSIVSHFCEGTTVYSQIDLFGKRRSKNTLRWAVLPFLYAASLFLGGAADESRRRCYSSALC